MCCNFLACQTRFHTVWVSWSFLTRFQERVTLSTVLSCVAPLRILIFHSLAVPSSTEAVDYYNVTKWCNFYQQALPTGTQREIDGGASSGNLHVFAKIALRHFVVLQYV